MHRLGSLTGVVMPNDLLPMQSDVSVRFQCRLHQMRLVLCANILGICFSFNIRMIDNCQGILVY